MSNTSNPVTISHEGIVQKVDNHSVTVTIMSASACSGCHAEGACSLSGKEEKSVIINGNFNFKTGETVNVLMKESLGYRAMFLGYLLPVLIVIAVLVALILTGTKELAAGLISISSVIPYYLILMLFGKKINEKFEFNIKLKE
jgi:sigma-E factor negative regulatory protein RseC